MSVWPDSVDQTLRAFAAPVDILEEYPSVIPQRLRLARGGVKLRTRGGAFWLRRARVGRAQLDAAVACTEALAARGWRLVPRFVRTCYGDPYVIDESGIYYLTAWFSGTACDFSKPEQLRAAVAALAAWHRSTSGILGANGESVKEEPPTNGSWLKNLQGALDQVSVWQARVQEEGEASPFARLFATVADELQHQVLAAAEQLRRMEFTEWEQAAVAAGEVCHGRFHGDALLFDGEQILVVDYERVHRGLPVTDLASWMHHCLSHHNWDPALVAELVKTYCQQRGLSATASAEEARGLAALLTIPMQTLQVMHWYARRALPWDEEDYADALEASLEREGARERAAATLLQQFGGRENMVSVIAPSVKSAIGQPEHEELAVVASATLSESDRTEDFAGAVAVTEAGIAYPCTQESRLTQVKKRYDGEEKTATPKPSEYPLRAEDEVVQLRLSPSQWQALRRFHEQRRRATETSAEAKQPGLRLWGDAKDPEAQS
jgi:CotS family spore coat protein